MRNLFFVLVLLMLLIVTPACQKTPAEFHIDSLEIVPQEAELGEIVTINAQVKNVGGTAGIYTVTLKIDGPGVTEKTESVTVAPGKTEPASFIVAKDKPKIYNVQVNDLYGTFRVLKKFLISDLIVTPPAAKIGQEVIVTANIANVGEFKGSYPAALLVNGNTLETNELLIAPGTTEKATFTFAENAAGTYRIDIGELPGILLVTEADNVLVQLGAAYPELCEELLRLPDLKEIDDRDMEAIEDIASLAFNAKYRSAFESMLDEGIKDKRKYCSPLEALLWIAYDKEFAGYNPLEYYSLDRLINDAWKNTTTSKNYTSDRWQEFDEVVGRLNSPDLVDNYMQHKIIYKTDLELYKVVQFWASASETFINKAGDCEDHATFAVYCLLKDGYYYDNFDTHTTNAVCGLNVVCDLNDGYSERGHSICLLKSNGLIYCLDNTNFFPYKGPFKNIEDIANKMYPDWIRCFLLGGNPGSSTEVARK